MASSAKVAQSQGTLRYWIDFETEGLLGRSAKTASGRRYGRYGPRISEVALVPEDPKLGNSVLGYTDLVTKEKLRRWGVGNYTKTKFLKESMPDSLYRHLIGKTGLARWGPAVAVERGFDGRPNTLNRVFRQHAAHVAGGGSTFTNLEMNRAILDALKAAPKNVELTGWNIASFDFPVLSSNMERAGLGREFGQVLKNKRIVIREGAERYHRLLFEHMIKDTSFTPYISDVARINAAAGQLATAKTSAKSAFMENRPLREFMTDISKGRSAFKARAKGWASKYRGTALESYATQAADRAVGTLSRIKDWESFKGTHKYLHKRSTLSVKGMRGASLFDIIGEMYRGGDPAFKHANVLGDSSRLIHPEITAGTVHGLQFAGGGKQEQVGRSLLHAMRKSGLESDARFSKLRNQLKRSHRASEDVKTAMLVDDILADKNPKLMEEFQKQHFSDATMRRFARQRALDRIGDFAAEERAQKVLNGNKPRVPGTKAHTRRTILTSTRAFVRKNWMAVGAGALGVAAIASLNRGDPPERGKAWIEGVRDPESDYRMVEGIVPSMLPGANNSHFRSGRHHEGPNFTASYLGKGGGGYMGTEHDRREGEAVHRMVEQMLIRKGFAQASEVNLSAYGMTGRMDIMLQGGIPLEIKSVDDSLALNAMMAPRARDVGQLNFDILATGAPYGYSLYTSREDPTKFKLFRMTADTARLMSDMSTLRMQAGGSRTPLSDSWGLLRLPFMGGLRSIVQDIESQLLPGEKDPFAELDIPEYSAEEFGTAPAWGPPMGGYVQNLAENAQSSKIRDHATQLHRLPGMIRTPRGMPNYRAISAHTEWEID